MAEFDILTFVAGKKKKEPTRGQGQILPAAKKKSFFSLSTRIYSRHEREESRETSRQGRNLSRWPAASDCSQENVVEEGAAVYRVMDEIQLQRSCTGSTLTANERHAEAFPSAAVSGAAAYMRRSGLNSSSTRRHHERHLKQPNPWIHSHRQQVGDAAVHSVSGDQTSTFWLLLLESFTGPDVTPLTSDRPAAPGSLCNWRHGAVSVYPEGRRLAPPHTHLPPFESRVRGG